MLVLKNNDIKSFPFSEASKLVPNKLLEWADETVHLTNFNTWMLPQLLAYFGSFKVRKNDAGKCDPMALLSDNLGSDTWARGVWMVTNVLKRSSLVKAQNNINYSKYSALVPLILAGLKEYQNIPYSAWDVPSLSHAMGSQLYDAATATPPDIPISRILELRKEGLTTKSGKTAGLVKSPTSTWTLTGLQHSEWSGLPQLTMTMLAQIWVAHPSIRHSNMILDPLDWDNIPEPLVPSELLNVPVSAMKYVSTTKSKDEEIVCPWL